MKPKAKMLVLMLGLMLPYMGFVLYRILTYPQHPFATWFRYVAPCYFFGSIDLFVVIRRKIAGDSPVQDSDRRNLKWLWIGVGLYSLCSPGSDGELGTSDFRITMNIYVKSVTESQVDAMDLLGAEMDKKSGSISPDEKHFVN